LEHAHRDPNVGLRRSPGIRRETLARMWLGA
jgi:hypothetical protein